MTFAFHARRDPALRRPPPRRVETARFLCEVCCLEPGQGQKPHAHAESDKLDAVLEGSVVARVGSEEAALKAGEGVLASAGVEHGVEKRSASRAAVLVFMAPHPSP